MTQREAILAKTVELLQTAAGSTATVHRYPLRPIEKDTLPALCVYPTDCKPTQGGQTWGLREYELSLRIEARTTGQALDQVLDPFTALIAQVMLSEPFLAGLAFRVEEGETHYDGLEGEHTFAASAQDFTVHFYDDPTGQGQWPFDPDGPKTQTFTIQGGAL